MSAAISVDQRQIEALERAARRRIQLFLLGFAAILGSLIYAVVTLNRAADTERRLRQFEQQRGAVWKKQADALEKQLTATRAAMLAGDTREANRLLRITLQDSQELKDLAAIRAPAAAATATTSSSAKTPGASVATVAQPRAPIRVSASAKPRPQDVYIQFAGRIARERIVELNRALRAAGWDVQGSSGERTASAAGLNEVRYSAAQDQEAAEALAAALTEAGVGSRPVRARRVSIIVAGTLEVWISN